MKKTEIRTTNAPLPVGPYSQAVRCGDLLFVSGVLPIDPNTKAVSTETQEAVLKIFSNLDAILKEAGISKDNIIKVLYYERSSIIHNIERTYAKFILKQARNQQEAPYR